MSYPCLCLVAFPRLLLAAAALLLSVPAQASEAVVVEIYRDCRLADFSVILDEGALSPARSAEIKARAASVADRNLSAALPRIVSILKNNGIGEVDITRQGFDGCEPQTSGKYVEAVGTYCGARLTKAELLVDREVMMSRSVPDMTFERFLRQAHRALREQEIYDRPLVTIKNAPDCVEEEPGGADSSG